MSSTISFAQNLQSDTGQEAIMFRLQSELRVLEILKKFLVLHIRIDKEYSSAMENASTSAMKSIEALLLEGNATATGSNCENRKSNRKKYLAESIISKETVYVIQDIQGTVKNFQRNSELLESDTIIKLNDLITQKKILLKSAEEEYTKMKGKLNKYVESVNKVKVEYHKDLDAYESAKKKFEESCSKLARHPRKSAESRDKFFRTKRRVNQSHANYLLMIQEASVYDRDFRSILIPGLLQIEQTWCEKQLVNWKGILDDILENCSGISIPARLRINEFKPENEYNKLIDKHKCAPLLPINFKFDPGQITSQPVTQDSLVIDSSTIDFLQHKIEIIEKLIKSMDLQLADKITQSEQIKSQELVEDLKVFEVNITKCEIARLQDLKMYLEAHLKSTDISNQIETMSQVSDTPSKKFNLVRTFFRNVSFNKKTISFEEESDLGLNSRLENRLDLDGPSANNSLNCFNIAESVADEDYFHGVLPREEVVRLLKNEGDYLVRETTKNGAKQLVLSALCNGHKHFKVQVTQDGQFRFEGPIFESVKDLLCHYAKCKIPITNRSGAVIVNPVKRENWELNNDDFELIEKIGKGNFGDVYKAYMNGSLVALKTCKNTLPDEQKHRFLEEARILKQYDHPNIVRFIGICVQKQPIMIVMELVKGGSLLMYLRNKGDTLLPRALIQICLNVASGMKYLEERNCLHRDLAARNCLIDESMSVIKISDFGMSREEHEYTVSHNGMSQIPIKWTAPEALNYGKYTTLSDVWSYGILMWEIFSCGVSPYKGMSNSQAREMVEAGFRMSAPEIMPDVIYQLMGRCWQYEPEQRPRFSEIHSELDVIAASDLI